MMSTDEVQDYFNSQGKGMAEFWADVEDSRAIHELETYNIPKSTLGSGKKVPPDGPEFPKFDGGYDKWLRLTAQDRAIVASLAQLADQDLSIHLYNAHTLSRKVGGWVRSSSQNRMPAKMIWPPRSWTAWPMKPKDVPRSQFRQLPESERDERVWRSMHVSRSSAEDLQETIVAVILKQAKQQFLLKNAEVQSSKSKSTLDKEAGNHGPTSEVSSESSITSETGPPVSRDSRMSHSEKEETEDNGLMSPKRKRRASDSTQGLKHTPSLGAQPVFLADDDKATALLAPIARHMLSNIDKLLTGLHRQRQGYITTKVKNSANTANTDVNDASPNNLSALAPVSPSKRFRRNSSRTAQSPPKRPKTTRRHDSSQKPSRNRSPSPIRSSAPTKSQRQSTAGFVPRNWSDVMGIASLTGSFDQEAIERAAARCASLFGEGLSFRTLSVEGNGDADRELDILPQGRRESAPPELVKKDGKVENVNTIKIQGVFCLFESCNRHKKGFPRNWHLLRHLKEVHRISTPEEVELAAQRGWSERTTPRDGDAILDGHETEGSNDDIEEGIHVDGYMQAIPQRSGWNRFHLSGPRTRKKRKTGGKDGGQSKNLLDPEEPMRARGRKGLQTDDVAESEGSGADATEEDGWDTERDQINITEHSS